MTLKVFRRISVLARRLIMKRGVGGCYPADVIGHNSIMTGSH